MDAITNEIVQQINHLPFTKKKTILELLKMEFFADRRPAASFQEQWKKELLTTSVWTEAQINAIHEAREFINQWTPQQFS